MYIIYGAAKAVDREFVYIKFLFSGLLLAFLSWILVVSFGIATGQSRLWSSRTHDRRTPCCVRW